MLGGARSGKSRYAEMADRHLPPPWIYVATAEAGDDEMAERIAAHRSRRGAAGTTVEAPLDLAGALDATPADAAVLVDCLTLWLSNPMQAELDVDAEAVRLTGGVDRAEPGRSWSSPTKSDSASCPTMPWRAGFAICKATSISRWRRRRNA